MSLDFNFPLEELEAAEMATANPYLSDPRKGLQLIARLVGQPRPDASQEQQRQLLAELHALIHERFIELAARGSYPGEAQALRELLTLEASLENLALFPDLANKTVIGVGGGFSAGKSRLLNTLLGVDLLPESLEPTTAIPSFITRGKDGIVALNTFNQQIPLDRDGLQAITHAFTTHYRDSLDESFGFAHVLKLLMLHHAGFAWSNLAFLDTPGYSKADAQGTSQTDEGIALKQLGEADQVIWLLSAKNGSIRQDDLEFLRTLDHPKPIFFVVTQADLVGRSRIDAILHSTAAAIAASGIPCAGLMAWEAPLGSEQGRLIAGDNIRDWLEQLDSEPKCTTHRRTCERVLDGYINHNQRNHANSHSRLSLFNTLLPLADQLPKGEHDTLRDLIQEQRSSQKNFVDLVSAFSALKDDMLAAVVRVVGDLAVDAPSIEELCRKGLALHKAVQHQSAVDYFQHAAELGSADAQFHLGIYNELGLGISMNERQAAVWYQKAADQGHADAQFYLGVCYENGVGVTTTSQSAVAWYLKAAEQGHADAQYNLGDCYSKGEGVPCDTQKATLWYFKAAEQNHRKAQFKHAQMLAGRGSKNGQYALGICHETGCGTPANIEMAIACYRDAAKAGHPDAQFRLGFHYTQGTYLRKNSAHAESWLCKAAKQDHLQAKVLLGELTGRSHPVWLGMFR
ncbi:MAG: dynamin family protein [Pseudomonas sp.]